jgi:hypothetical protein
MAIKKFNSIDGFSVGSDTPIAVIDNVANVSANSLLVSNLSNLGNVGNITITGGSAGFVLQTDGTGNLTFVDPTSTGVAGSNTQVQFNNNNSFGASPNFTFNSASSTLSVTNLSVTTNSNSSNVYTTNVYSSNYYSPTGDLNLYAGSGNSSISLTTTGNGTIDVNDTRITSLATPQFDNDAATKKYVDDVAQGLNIHDSCKVATTANIATLSGGTVAYNNGASGVGANLVITGGSITTIDTYSLQNLDRILVKNEANLTWNGIYTWATGGTVLTRATDFNTPAEIEGGDFTFVTDGNVYQNTGWVQTDNVTTIGTDSIEWQQFSGAGTYEAGNGLSLNGTVFSVNVDNDTIEINSDVLRVKANAQFVTPDIDSATGNSLTLGTSGYIQAGNLVTANYFTGTLTTASQPNITSLGNLVNLSVTGSATIGGNTTIAGNANVSGNIIGTNYVIANYFTGIITTTHQPNIESVGNLVGLTVSNVTGVVNFNTTANVSLGNISNLHILGGGSGYVLKTDGTGNLSWGVDSTSAAGSNGDVQFNDNGSLGANSNFNFNKTTSVLTVIGNLVTTNADLGNLVTANYFTGNGALLTFVTGSNVSGNVDSAIQSHYANIANSVAGANVSGNVDSAIQAHYANIANSVAGANVSGQVGNALIAGTVYTNAQPNITSLGTLSSLSVTANVTAGNITGANLISANYLVGDGSLLSNINAANIIGAYSNSNVANYLPTYTGNISANYFIGNGATLTFITGSNVSGNVGSAIQSHYANIANSVSGSNVSGNVADAIHAYYADTANSVAGANVNGQVGNALIAGTVYTAAQPNITSVGSLTSLVVSGDATVTGNLTVSGNTNYINVDTLVVQDPIIEMGGGPNGAPLASNDGKDRGSLLHYYTTSPVDAFMGWDNSNAEFAFGSNVNTSNEVVTFNSFGNIRAGYFIGNGATLTSITGTNVTGNVDYAITSNWANTANSILGTNVSGNVDSAIQSHYANIANSVSGSNVNGQVGNALIAGTVYTNAQPNITSVGTLNSLSVTANITAGNITGANLISANYFVGDGSLLTNINAGNITGAYSNTNVAAYLPTYTGNLSANYFIGNGSTLTYITGANVLGNVDNAIQSHYANTANSVAGANVTGQVGNALVAGTVYTAAQSNITSLGTLTGLTVDGLTNLGDVSNLYISGGSAGYVLTTDGYGDLSWEQATGNGGASFVSIRKDNFVGNGVQTQFSLTAVPSGEDAVEVNLNGLIQQGYVYNVVGSNVVFTTPPVSGANIEITTFGALAINQTDSQILFIDGSNLVGSNNFTFTESNNTLSVNNVSSTANITAGNLKSDNLLYANGSPYIFTTSASGSNTQVQFNDSNSFAGSANFTFDKGTNTLSVTNIIANGSGITYITGSNVSGNVNYAITSNWANTANSISGSNVSGNVDYAITSNWANIANSVSGANVSGQVGNALIAGTVYTAAQPNITSVGTLTSLVVSGNATITGNLTVSGTTEYTNVNNLYIKDPIIEMGGGANGDPLTTNDGKDRGTLLHYYTTGTVDAFMGWDNSNAEFAFGSNVSVSSEVVTFNSFGNIRANYFIGDGSLLTNINAANITGAYSNTNVAAYLPTYTGNVSANYFIGNGSILTDITGANVTGYVSLAITANTAGTVTTAAQPNITSVGNLTTLTVTGNVSANYFIGNGSLLTGLPASYSNTNVAAYLPTYTGNVSANYFIGNGSSLTDITGSNVTGYVPNANLANTATVAGTVTTNAQPNITSVGTLANLTVTGNLSAGNVAVGSGTGGSLTGANLISANYFAGDGSLLTNINAANITGSYSNANVANYLPTYTGNVSANYFIGNGSTLTNITGSNVIGNVSFAITSNWANTANSISGSNVTGQVGNALIAGTVYTNAQPNITSLGNLTSLVVTGNATAGNLLTDGIYYSNGAPYDLVANASGANTTVQFNDDDAFAGSNNFTFNKGTNTLSVTNITANGAGITFITGSNVSGNVSFAVQSHYANIANSVAGANVSGNVASAVQSHYANIANSVAGANVSGQVSNALIAGTVYTNAQPNITSIGTLSSLDVTGNISAGNANLGNTVIANYFIGNGSLLTGLPAQYANSNVANYLPTYTGNVSANYFIGNGSTLTNITGSNVSGNVDFAITSNWANTANSVAGANVSGTVANATYATSAGSATSATTAGTVTTASQPNITSLGTLTELTVDGLTDLGPIGNITITGGTSGYVLTTNGTGDLSWQAATGNTGPGFVNITKNSFTGNSVQTIFTLTTTPASEASLLVNIDGITQQDAAYSLSGSDVTFASAPLNGEIVEIVSYGSIGIGSNTTVLFNDAGDIGNTSTFSFNKYSNTLSVTNIDTTSVNFDTGVITVAGANAGIFTSGVDNINLGLGANVTVGSSSGNTTVQGNLIAGNISTTSNLAISGTATISNLKVNDLYSNRIPVSVTTNTIVDSFSVNKYRSAKYTMRVNSDDGYQAVEVLLIHDGSNSYVTIYGSLSTIGTDIVILSSNILSGNVRLLATTGSANTTVNLLGTYVAD